MYDMKALYEAHSVEEAVRLRLEHPEAQIIWGLSLDDAYGDEVRVTVIAAGFDANSKKPDQPAEEKPAAAKENTVPLSALSAGVQAPAQQPQPVQLSAQEMVGSQVDMVTP